MPPRSGFASISHFGLRAQPVHSLGSPSLPRPRFTPHERFWCRTFPPALHRLRLLRPRLRARLTLGRLTVPRNPQACGVDGCHIQLTLLIPAFALLGAPPVLTIRLLGPQNAPLPCPPTPGRHPQLRSTA